jgi:hypothetical protein
VRPILKIALQEFYRAYVFAATDMLSLIIQLFTPRNLHPRLTLRYFGSLKLVQKTGPTEPPFAAYIPNAEVIFEEGFKRLINSLEAKYARALSEAEEEKRSTRSFSVSAIHFAEKQKRAARSLLILSSGVALYLLGCVLSGGSPSFPAIVLVIGYALLVAADQALLALRIKKGFYGNNEQEAREIISFVLSNIDTLDPGEGGHRPIFDDAKDNARNVPAFNGVQEV